MNEYEGTHKESLFNISILKISLKVNAIRGL